MPDIAVAYTLTTPAGVVVFNDGVGDEFYITNIPSGLAGAPIRAPIDNIAFGDGSRGYNFWKAGRHIMVEGIFLVRSLSPSNARVTLWNDMEDELRDKLDSIAATTVDTATLVWRPLGQTLRTLVVRNDVPLECQPDQNYITRTFTFGLFAADPVWVEST